MKWLFTIAIPLLTNIYVQAQTMPYNQLQKKISYQVEWIGNRPLIDSSYLNIILDKNNKAYGMAGCNFWSTSYQLQSHNLYFNKSIKVTKKICSPALIEQEQHFLKTLITVTHWDFSKSGQLRLWPDKGQPIKLWQEKQPNSSL